MRAITLHQPEASLIAIGAKSYTTWAYPPPIKMIGQRIAIHAAVKPILATWRGLDHKAQSAILIALAQAGLHGDLGTLPHGAVICTAVLVGAGRIRSMIFPRIAYCSETRGYFCEPFPTDMVGDFSTGRWAWELTDVIQFSVPAPVKGRQGWWEWEGRANG